MTHSNESIYTFTKKGDSLNYQIKAESEWKAMLKLDELIFKFEEPTDYELTRVVKIEQ